MTRRSALFAWLLMLQAIACSRPAPSPAADAGPDVSAPAPPPIEPTDAGSHHLGAFLFAYPVGPAGGSLSGTYPNPTVNISNLDAGALSPGSAGQVLQTNATPAPTWTTVTGDTTISSSGVTTTGKINGASVPAAGSLTTGNVLQVSGSSSLTYGLVSSTAGISPGLSGQVLWTPNGSASTLWSYEAMRNASTADLADPTGSLDSSSAIHTCLVNGASSHQCCWLPPGTFKIASTVAIPSNGCLTLSPGTTVNSTLSITGTATNATFSATPTVSGTSTTLSGTPTFGSQTLTLTSATGFSTGQTISITSAAHSVATFYFVVQNLVSTTVTTDRPILFPFSSGDTVKVITTAPTNVVVQGKGTIAGTADSLVYMQGCQNCRVEDVLLTPTSTSLYGVFFDAGGYRNVARGVRIEANGHGSTTGSFPAGVFFEANQDGLADHSTVKNFSPGAAESAGFLADDCANVTFRNVTATGDNIGGGFSSFPPNTAPGCYHCIDIGGTYEANSTGFAVANTSTGDKLIQSDMSDSSGNGLLIEANTVDTAVIGGHFKNTSAGNGITFAGVSAMVTGAEVGGNQYGIETTSGFLEVTAVTAPVANSSGFFISGSGATQTNISDVDAQLGSGYGVFVQASAVTLNGAAFVGGSTALHVDTTGVLSFDNVTLSGTPSIGLSVANTGTANIGLYNSLASATTPISNSGTALTEWDTYGASAGVKFFTAASSPYWYVQQGSTKTAAMGPYSNGSTIGAVFLGSTAAGAPSTTNYTLANDNSNAYLNGAVSDSFEVAATQYMYMTSAALYPATFGGLTAGTTSDPWGDAYLGASTTSGSGYEAIVAPAHSPDGTYPQLGQILWGRDFGKVTAISSNLGNASFAIPALAGSNAQNTATVHYTLACTVDVVGTSPYNATTGATSYFFSDCTDECTWTGSGNASCKTALQGNCTNTSGSPSSSGSCLASCGTNSTSGATVTLVYSFYQCGSTCASSPTLTCTYDAHVELR